MQVKVISEGDSFVRFERKVNEILEGLKDKKIIDIKFTDQQEGFLTAYIMYEESV